MTTLCHLLHLAGYKSGQHVRENSELYEDVDTLLILVKSLLMKLTGLTDKVAQNLNNNFGDDEVLLTSVNLVLVHNDPKVDKEKKKAAGNRWHNLLASNMAHDNYNTVVKEINQATNMGLKMYHLLSNDLPTAKEFSCQYKEDCHDPSYTEALNDDDMVTNNHMSEEQNTKGTDSLEKSANTVTCNRAVVSIEECLTTILKQMEEILAKKVSQR